MFHNIQNVSLWYRWPDFETYIDVVDGYWRHFYVSVKFEMLVTDLGCKLPISNLTVEHPKKPLLWFPSAFWKMSPLGNKISQRRDNDAGDNFMMVTVLRCCLLNHSEVTLMLVTDVGDQTCWWQVWDVGDRLNRSKKSPT